MKHQTPESMKFRKLQRRLGVSRVIVAGTLELLWIATQKNTPRGDIGKFTDEEIAIECDWEGDPELLVAALVECGWLDRCETYRLVIHDWESHAPAWIKRQLGRHKQSFVTANSPLNVTDDDLEATPNPTQPNLTQPNIVRTLRPPDVSGKGQEIIELATSIAREFDGDRRLKPDDRELAYKAAVMELCVPEVRGLVVPLRIQIGQKIRSREPPANPWAYFRKSLIGVCEENDVDFHQLWPLIEVPEKPKQKRRTDRQLTEG